MLFRSEAEAAIQLVLRHETVDQVERVLIPGAVGRLREGASGRPLDDAEYARMDAQSATLAPLYALGMALTSTLLPFIVAGAARLVLKPADGTHPRFTETLAVLAHANVILALRQLVATPVAFLRESLASSTTLIQFVPSLDETSPFARFFGGVDLFVLWWIVVASMGLALVYRRPATRVIMTLTGAYVLLAAAAAAGMAIAGGGV